MTAAVARVHAYVATAFAGFAIWGSLLPFDFHAVPVGDAARLFSLSGRVGATAVSVTDIVSNFLLFVPIGFFATGALSRTLPSRAVTLLVVSAGAFLSIALESAQAFVSWRTPSVLDILAEVSGAAAGLALLRRFKTELDSGMATALALWQRLTIGDRWLIAYAAAFTLVWLFPFDFTLRLSEIYDKYVHKRLLLPWVPSPDAATPLSLRLAFVAAVPLGWAGAACGCRPGVRRSVMRASVVVSLWILATALAQVLVYTRTTDTTMVVAVLPGVLLGAGAARLTKRSLAPATERPQ